MGWRLAAVFCFRLHFFSNREGRHSYFFIQLHLDQMVLGLLTLILVIFLSDVVVKKIERFLFLVRFWPFTLFSLRSRSFDVFSALYSIHNLVDLCIDGFNFSSNIRSMKCANLMNIICKQERLAAV